MSLNLNSDQIRSCIDRLHEEVQAHKYLESTSQTDVNTYFQSIHSIFQLAVGAIEENMRSCSQGRTLIAAKEAEYFTLTGLHEQVTSVFKQACHNIRTHHPLYEFVSDDRTVCSAPFPLVQLIEKDPSLTFLIRDDHISIEKSTYREILGDGNCFFHAVATSLISLGKLDTIYENMGEMTTLTDLRGQIGQFLYESQTNPESALMHTDSMMKLIRILREMSHLNLRNSSNPDLLQAQLIAEFPEDAEKILSSSFEDMVKMYTCQMGKEACHPVIEALCRELKLHVTIHSLRTSTKTTVGNKEGALAHIDVVLSGQHYFLLNLAEKTPSKIQAFYKGAGELGLRGPSGVCLFRTGESEAPYPFKLSWDVSAPMTQIADGVWEALVLNCPECKIVLNNEQWCHGDNLEIIEELSLHEVVPSFSERTSLEIPFDDTDPESRYILCGEGQIEIEGQIKDLSWDPLQGIEIRRLSPFLLGASLKVISPTAQYKLVKLSPGEDPKWETGDNHTLRPGERVSLTPLFS